MKNILFTICLIITAGLYAQTTHIINTGGFYYNPSSLSINVGDSVIWINEGGNHDVNGDISSLTSQPYNNPVTFDSPATNIVGAIIFGYKFTVSGTYNYDCSVYGHASQGMVGVIIVDTILSIKQKTNFINIYPNPTNENITISIQDYARGIYLLKVTYGDRVEEVKVIKD
jgi:plastocyanin